MDFISGTLKIGGENTAPVRGKEGYYPRGVSNGHEGKGTGER
jgi:hypothetical protein